MAFFGLFGKRKNSLEKHAERVAKKRAQAADRWESIEFLGRVGAGDEEGYSDVERSQALSALMVRFTFYADPSITDNEEKDRVFRWVCQSGAQATVPLRKALKTQPSLGWPLRCLQEIEDTDGVDTAMLELLSSMDIEYERDPEKKQQLLCFLEERHSPGIATAVAPFFEDVNESARFHAVGAALNQENADTVLEELRAALAEEESLRIKNRIFTAMSEHKWTIGDAAGQVTVPAGFTVDKAGLVHGKA